MTEFLADKLTRIPTSPGVYQHKDAKGKVIYVGKAKNLRTRVRSYFQEGRPKEARIHLLVKKIVDIDIIVTDTEAEALILENNLIKELKPRYNVLLKDDKTYPYICIKKEPFPRIFPTRKVIRDGSKYFGPYTNVGIMNQMLKTVRSIFQLRNCNLDLSGHKIAAGKYETCLEYQIKKCAGPCVELETEEQYDNTISQIEKLLHGKTSLLLSLLKDEMKRLSMLLEFEEAAQLRDRIIALEKYSSKQKIVTTDPVDRDLFALSVDREYDAACAVVFKVREGKMLGRQNKIIRKVEGIEDAEILQRFVDGYYAETTFFPDEVLLSILIEDPDPVAALLHEKRGKIVELKVPERGDKAGLMRMITANAKLLLGEYREARIKAAQEAIPHAVKALERDLYLKKLPRHIECFDISHLGGTGTVASCVVFIDGRPANKQYRHYHIRTVEEGKPDDFASMREVVGRRYRHLLRNDGPFPDLIVIDGGKGQLSSAVTTMKEIGYYGKSPVIGLAKRMEEVFFPGDSQSLMIPKTSSALRLLTRIRDEAHRFAITFQREQRKKKVLKSELHSIPNVGKKTAEKLLKHFGSVKKVKLASEAEISGVIGPALGKKVTEWFKK